MMELVWWLVLLILALPGILILFFAGDLWMAELGDRIGRKLTELFGKR